MVLRNLFATDNNSLIVDSSPSAGLVGNPIINNSDTPDGTVFTFSAGGGTTVTIDDTGGDVDTFEDDNPAGHIVTDGGGIVADGTPVESESLIFVQALDGGGAPVGPVITITVFSQNGVTSDVWGFATDIPLTDGVSYVKVGGSNIGSATYVDFVTCFAQGTPICTPQGDRPIETLTCGDLVWTRDNGNQPIKWIGQTEVDAVGCLAPVAIAPGTFGNARELVLSQEHRVLFQTAEAELLFGAREVLLAAKHLLGVPGVRLRTGGTVRYFHMMFDTHQIVKSDSMLSESFFLSQNSLNGVEQSQLAELLALFPSLAEGFQSFGPTAAPVLKRREAELFCKTIQARAA